MTVIDFIQYLFRPKRVPFVCDFSSRNSGIDIHDYHVCAGGDGEPTHFYTYKCWNCGKEFSI